MELTLSGEAPGNATKLLDRCSQVNFGRKHKLFLVQIWVQMNSPPAPGVRQDVRFTPVYS